jgi:hypothetical protein
LVGNDEPMMREIAHDVTGELIPDAGQWVAEEDPVAFCRLFTSFDARDRKEIP